MIKFEDLKIGQHLWVISQDKLLVVAKFNEDYYNVCGPWEGGISKNECKIIELIDVPEKYKKYEMYYK